MVRVFSGIQPSGDIHLGNYLGALRNWAAMQDEADCIYCIVDLHAITSSTSPEVLLDGSRRAVAAVVAAGIDPDRSILFAQSHVPQHSSLAWQLQCITGMGELRRMTQFKDKTSKVGTDEGEHIPVGLFTYPTLMAADILLYDTDKVPVGADQRQHIELTRDLALRFNSRFGDTFVVPDAAIPPVGARIMDLQEPTSKMSKSTGTEGGLIYLFEDPARVAKKLKRAVTDSGDEVIYDPENKPGVSNLLEILAAASGSTPAAEAANYDQYGRLKVAAADAVVAMLDPIRTRYEQLMSDPGEIDRILAGGAAKAAEIASVVQDRASRAMGFLPPAAT